MKNDKKEKISNIIKLIKDIYKTPRGKALLFFGFYFIFFLVLAILARVGDNRAGSSINLNNNSNLVSLSSVKSNNYKFLYTILIDQNSYIYQGSKRDDIELFSFFNDQYFKKDDVFYKSFENSFIEVDNPYLYKDFLDLEVIDEIVSNATYISRTEYENKEKVYNYKISTVSLVKIIDELDIDISDLANDIFIYTYSDGSIKRVEFVLNSYGIFSKICNDSFSISLEYSDYGMIKDISIPID